VFALRLFIKRNAFHFFRYSSQCDLLCPFTRDLHELREKLELVESLDNTNILAALKGVVSYVQEQWTNSVPINIVLVTDEGEIYVTIDIIKVIINSDYQQ
jgi:Mg-chelatase subunit ChlD